MRLKYIGQPMPGMEGWGYREDGASYLVTFDSEHPQFGYRASYQLQPGSTVHLGEFPSFASAESALAGIATGQAH